MVCRTGRIFMHPSEIGFAQPKYFHCVSEGLLSRIGFVAVRCIQVEPFAQARNPSYKLTADCGPYGVLHTSAQLPLNYPLKQMLIGKTMIAVLNLGVRKIAGFSSEFLVVGFPGLEGRVHLLNVRGKSVDPGEHLTCTAREFPVKIPFSDFHRADIRAATVEKIYKGVRGNHFSKPISLLVANLGELGYRHVMLEDLDEDLMGTQVAVIVNLAGTILTPEYSKVLSIKAQGKTVPLGVDGVVANGARLF